MSEGIEKCSKKSRSSSSWIRSTIQEILNKNKGVAEEEEEGLLVFAIKGSSILGSYFEKL